MLRGHARTCTSCATPPAAVWPPRSTRSRRPPASASACGERAVPVPPAVANACALLGLDPMYVANEGKLVAFVPRATADAVLAAMRAHPLRRRRRGHRRVRRRSTRHGRRPHRPGRHPGGRPAARRATAAHLLTAPGSGRSAEAGRPVPRAPHAGVVGHRAGGCGVRRALHGAGHETAEGGLAGPFEAACTCAAPPLLPRRPPAAGAPSPPPPGRPGTGLFAADRLTVVTAPLLAPLDDAAHRAELPSCANRTRSAPHCWRGAAASSVRGEPREAIGSEHVATAPLSLRHRRILFVSASSGCPSPVCAYATAPMAGRWLHGSDLR